MNISANSHVKEHECLILTPPLSLYVRQPVSDFLWKFQNAVKSVHVELKGVLPHYVAPLFLYPLSQLPSETIKNP